MLMKMGKKDKTKNIRNLNNMLDDYNNVLDKQKLNLSEELKDKINILQIESQDYIKQKEKNKKTEAFVVLCFFLAFIVSLIFNILQNRENEILRNDITVKKNIIAKLQWSDSLFNQIMNVRYDSITKQRSVSFKTLNGQIITYDALSKENDILSIEKIKLMNEATKSKNEIIERQWSDSLFNQIMEVKINPNDHSRSIFYREKNGKIITYKELGEEIDTLSRKNINLNLENDILKQKLNVIQKYYNITFKETDKSIIIEALKLDSALMLLPYYRNKIEYNPENNSWLITYSK